MVRINNLYNLHKIREAKITNDNKKLIVRFEMSKPVGLKNTLYTKTFKSKNIGIEGRLSYDQKLLSIDIDTKENDSKKLFKLFLVISYLLGQEITLWYEYQELPYFDLPKYFNFGDYHFCFVNQKNLIEKTEQFLERGFELLNDDNSYFSKMVPYILSINTIVFHDIRFFSEFSLLEKLAKDYPVQNKIFNDKKEIESLKTMSDHLQNQFNELIKQKSYKVFDNKLLKDKIKKTLDVNKLNEKGNSKDKISFFINQFTSNRIRQYSKYVREWNLIRNKKGIAHGSGVGLQGKDEDDTISLSNELHHFLSEIVYQDFHSIQL